jgi:hypothetical protein
MNIKKTLLTLFLCTIAGATFMPVVAMDEQPHKRRKLNSSEEAPATTSTLSSTTTDSLTARTTIAPFFAALPIELINCIRRRITTAPKKFDFGKYRHRMFVRKILKLSHQNRFFRHVFVPLFLRNIHSIRITDVMLQKKSFPALCNFLSLFNQEKIEHLNFPLLSIDLSHTNISDEQLKNLLDAINRKKIAELDLGFCKNIKNPSLENLTKLTILNLDTTNITDEALGNILKQEPLKKTLQEINLYNCKNLIKPVINSLSSLKTISLEWCTNIQSLTLETQPKLTTILLDCCVTLSSFNIDKLPMIEKIEILRCFKLKQLTLPIEAKKLELEEMYRPYKIAFTYVDKK